jgi:hypothetical protein
MDPTLNHANFFWKFGSDIAPEILSSSDVIPTSCSQQQRNVKRTHSPYLDGTHQCFVSVSNLPRKEKNIEVFIPEIR